MQDKRKYWIIESGRPVNPVILGEMNKNMLQTFIGLFHPTPARSLDEAKEVKAYAEKYYSKEFVIRVVNHG